MAAKREAGQARGMVTSAGDGVAAAMVRDRLRDGFESTATLLARAGKAAPLFFKTQPLQRGGGAADLARRRFRIFPPAPASLPTRGTAEPTPPGDNA